MNFIIRNTVISDIPSILSLAEQAITYQKKHHYPVWRGFDKEKLRKDIQEGNHYKVEANNKIAYLFSLYNSDKIIWRERDKAHAVYLHGMIVNPKFKGLKLFDTVLHWIKSRPQKISFIRMDTWAENQNLITYYQSLGFYIVDYFTTPETDMLPIQQQGNRVVLLESKV